MVKGQEIRLRTLLELYADDLLDQKAFEELKVLLGLPGADVIWEAVFVEGMEKSGDLTQLQQEDWNKIWKRIESARQKQEDPADMVEQEQKGLDSRTHVLWLKRISVAAAVLAFLIGCVYIISRINGSEVEYRPGIASTVTKVIVPGRSGAVLHLMDGKTVDLGRAKDGVIAVQSGMKVVKSDGTLRYTGTTAQVLYNEISTSRGREWNFTLPDGSRVWLNSASSIRFPLSFATKERLVEIKGEAYFEVKHNAAQPFKVKVNGQIIEDIGTAFNVNAYPNEPSVKTTLISGSILLQFGKKSVIMKPGQQALVKDNISVHNLAEPQQEVAWKNGMFQYTDADLQTIMRQLARWYNVEVVYLKKPLAHQFTGKIPKNMSIKDVLKILEQAGAHFKVEAIAGSENDGRILVSP